MLELLQVAADDEEVASAARGRSGRSLTGAPAGRRLDHPVDQRDGLAGLGCTGSLAHSTRSPASAGAIVVGIDAASELEWCFGKPVS